MTRTKALIVLLVFVFAGAVYADVSVFILGGRVASNQSRETQALCAFRDDVQRRMDETSAFLRAHPHGIPGITAATLRAGVDNERHTIRALSPLDC